MRVVDLQRKFEISSFAFDWLKSAVSLFVCLISIFCIYQLFQNYDWGHPLTKFLCFSGLFALVLLLYKHREQEDHVGLITLKLETLFALALLSLFLFKMLSTYLPFATSAPTVDIGYTTQHAVELLFQHGQNPYLDQTINVRPELAPEHRGFHYGPGMLLGYALSAAMPDGGYKLTSIFFLSVTAVSLCMLLAHSLRDKGKWEFYSACAIAMLLFFMPERLWLEVLKVGANDIYPVALLLVGLVLVQREQWLLAGILMGLSFATKFSPAAFLLAMFLRKDIRLHFLIGCTLGTVPLLAMLVWDYQGLIENVFILRFTLNYDATSLYSITPDVLHILFPLAQLSALGYLLVRNWDKNLPVEDVIVCFTLLLIIIEVTFKEIHANHLIWFYPLIAYIVAVYRHKLFPKISQ